MLCLPGQLYAQISLPLKKMSLTSAFGYRVHPLTGRYALHKGVDLKARSDTVFSVSAGIVSACGYNILLGIYIRVNNGEIEFSYGHLSQLWVLPGDTVVAGQSIGITGVSGRVTGEHLHFGVSFKQRPVDPLAFLYAVMNEENK